MKNNLKIIILIVFLIATGKANAADYFNSPIPQVIGNVNAFSAQTSQKSSQKASLKDSNEKLYAVVGKSQLIKFDEPVKRISITDPAFADIVLLSPTELLINGKKAGRTSLIFWGESNKPIFFNMVVQQDSDSFVQAIEQIAPEDNLNFIFTDDGLILSGSVSSTSVKKQIQEICKAYGVKYVDLTESPTKQVLLEVKIAEVSRNFSRDIESKFNVGENYASFLTDVLGLSRTFDKLSNVSSNGTAGQYIYASDSAKVAWAISAGEQKGVVKILAEPKLLAIDGKDGSFNVGNQIPVPSQLGQYGNVSYTFKDTGVLLKFTPTILEKSNRISLKLAPEISEVDESYETSTGVPGFKTRKVETTVELNDGETLIIAGLLNQSSSKSRSQIPWIGDIPVLGILFSSISTNKKDNEFMIFITPHIINPNDNPLGTSL